MSAVPGDETHVPLGSNYSLNRWYHFLGFLKVCGPGVLPDLHSQDYVIFLPRELIIVDEVEGRGSLLCQLIVWREDDRVVTFRADYPDWHSGVFEVRPDLEVTVGLEKSEEANICLLVDALNDEVISHVFVAIENITGRFAYQDDVNQLLRGVTVLCEK